MYLRRLGRDGATQAWSSTTVSSERSIPELEPNKELILRSLQIALDEGVRHIRHPDRRVRERYGGQYHLCFPRGT